MSNFHEKTETLLRLIRAAGVAGILTTDLADAAGQTDKTLRIRARPLVNPAAPLARKFVAIARGNPVVYVAVEHVPAYLAQQQQAEQAHAIAAKQARDDSRRRYLEKHSAMARVKTAEQRNSSVRPERLRVEALITALPQGEHLTVDQIASAADLNAEQVRRIMQALRADHLAVNLNMDNPGSPAQWARPMARSTQPAGASRSHSRVCNSNTSGHYVPHELRPFEGRHGAMDAHRLPSRMHDRLHHPDGRVEAFPNLREAQP